MTKKPAAKTQTSAAKSVFGLASSRIQANRIVGHLINAGFSSENISVLMPDAKINSRAASGVSGSTPGIATGLGSAVSGALGWLAGMEAFNHRGMGLLIAGGPMFACLGMAAIRPPGGGVKTALVNMGISRDTAGDYKDRIMEGQILVCLHAHEWREAEAARKIFLLMGASNITLTGEQASGMLARAISLVIEQNSRPARDVSPCPAQTASA